jgi:DNA-binding transcriptional LysR family regulator
VDFKELEAFVQVYELLSFSRAAEQLYLAQSTVSGYIAALERNLNCRLLLRTTKEICPTDMGRLFYEYAKELLRVRAAAMQALQLYRKEMKGTVSLAASSIPGQYYLPRVLHDFREQYPDISFNMQVVDSAEVVDLVSSRKVDLGFTGTMFDNTKCSYEEFRLRQAGHHHPAQRALPGISENRLSHPSDHKRALHPPRNRQRLPQGDRTVPAGNGNQYQDLRIARGRALPGCHQATGQRGRRHRRHSEKASQDYCQFGKIFAFNLDIADIERKLYIIRHKNGSSPPLRRPSAISPGATTFRLRLPVKTHRRKMDEERKSGGPKSLSARCLI